MSPGIDTFLWFAVFLLPFRWNELSATEISATESRQLRREWNDCCSTRDSICIGNTCYIVESRASSWFNIYNRCRSRYSDWPKFVDLARFTTKEDVRALSDLLKTRRRNQRRYEDLQKGAWTGGIRCREKSQNKVTTKYQWASTKELFPQWLINDIVDSKKEDEEIGCMYLVISSGSPSKPIYNFQKENKKYPAICQFVIPDDIDNSFLNSTTQLSTSVSSTESLKSSTTGVPILSSEGTEISYKSTSTPHRTSTLRPTSLPTTKSSTSTKTTTSKKVRTRETSVTKYMERSTTEIITTSEKKIDGCTGRFTNGIYWPDTPPGETVRKSCPQGMKGTAEWTCDATTLEFFPLKPKIQRCRHEWLDELQEEVRDSRKDAVELSKQIANKTIHTLLSHGDLSALVNLTEKLLKLFMKQHRNIDQLTHSEPLYHFAKSMITSYNHVLRKELDNAWNDLEESDKMKEASRILQQISMTGHHLSCSVTSDDIVQHTVAEQNINLQTFLMDIKDDVEENPYIFPKNIPGETNNTLTFPSNMKFDLWPKSICKNKQNTAVGILYKNLEQFLGNTNPVDESIGGIVVSPIISFAINNGTRNEQLPHGSTILIELERYAEPDDIQLYNQPRCVFWNFNLGKFGNWDSSGCFTLQNNNTHTICSCNHLTNFAIIMDVNNHINVDDRLLELMTIVCCGVSVISLVATCFVLIGMRSLHCRRSTITCNLSICLLLINILILFGFNLTQFRVLCATIAGLVHFLILAAFCWMLLEGFHLYQMIVLVFSHSSHLSIAYFYCFGYGMPLIIVTVSAAIEYEGYGRSDICWISNDQGLMYSLIGPVALIICINFVIFFLTMKSASSAKIKNEQSVAKKAKAWLKGSLSILCLLGLTWSIGFLYMIQNLYFTSYIFTLLNGLQGLFIFIFHVLLNEKVTNAFIKTFQKKMKKRRMNTQTTLISSSNQHQHRSLSTSLTNASKNAEDIPSKTFSHQSLNGHLQTTPNFYISNASGSRSPYSIGTVYEERCSSSKEINADHNQTIYNDPYEPEIIKYRL